MDGGADARWIARAGRGACGLVLGRSGILMFATPSMPRNCSRTECAAGALIATADITLSVEISPRNVSSRLFRRRRPSCGARQVAHDRTRVSVGATDVASAGLPKSTSMPNSLTAWTMHARLWHTSFARIFEAAGNTSSLTRERISGAAASLQTSHGPWHADRTGKRGEGRPTMLELQRTQSGAVPGRSRAKSISPRIGAVHWRRQKSRPRWMDRRLASSCVQPRPICRHRGDRGVILP